MSIPKVAFVCVHNSCRSQMAEALARLKAAGVMEPYSAGTELKTSINPDAVRCVMRLYGVDMEEQRPKLLGDIPPADIVVTMGCGVDCPWLPCAHCEDWGLADPTGGPDEGFDRTARSIEEKIMALRQRILDGTIRWQQKG